MHQMYSVLIMPSEFNRATITDHFGFVFEENSGREITSLCSWRDLARDCFCFGREAVNASAESSRGLVMIREFPSWPCPRENKITASRQKSLAQESRHIRKSGNHVKMMPSFQKSSVSECFPSTLKRNSGVFKFFRFEERKASFLRRISVDGRPNRRNKAAC